MNLKSGALLIIYYLGMITVSAMRDFGRGALFSHIKGLCAVAIVALVSYFLGINTEISPVNSSIEQNSLSKIEYKENNLANAKM